MRICSLLPSSTEIIYALGLGDSLVGVTHECDYPPQALRKPRVTQSDITSTLSSAKIDFRVRQQLENVGSLYRLDIERLEELKPDIVFTQQLCTVCAVSYDNVYRTARELSSKPHVVNLEPKSIEDVFDSILEVGRLANVVGRAQKLVHDLRQRMRRIRQLTGDVERRKILFLEWLEPPFCAGHWVPELIDYAGGIDPFCKRHRPSVQLAWEQILSYNPDVTVVSCCGFSVERTLDEIQLFQKNHTQLFFAVKKGSIFIVDGSSYFSRPGPRIIDSLEILATILHPELFPIDYPRTVVQQIEIGETVYAS